MDATNTTDTTNDEKQIDALLEIGGLVAKATVEAMNEGVYLPALGELGFLVSDVLAGIEREAEVPNRSRVKTV
ncbi:MAG: hypothetical protein GY854_02395 [Deltaproteobacteria bacterium]|nr:hypothetical protein [Deltaproteobacteria bacterium]